MNRWEKFDFDVRYRNEYRRDRGRIRFFAFRCARASSYQDMDSHDPPVEYRHAWPTNMLDNDWYSHSPSLQRRSVRR